MKIRRIILSKLHWDSPTYDMLITDVVMPEMNGRDLANTLLSISPNLKRLFMSGYTADIIARQGVMDEGEYFLAKPFTRDNIAQKVCEILSERQVEDCAD